MAKIETKAGEKIVPAEQKIQIDIKRHDVNIDTPLKDVLQWIQDGDALYFDGDKDKFKELDGDTLALLDHANKVRYSMAREFNQRHDPEGDEFVQRFQVQEQRDRRAEFESRIKSTAQSARATKKMEAFVGNNFEPYWTRPDKIEDKLAQGYEIVKGDSPECYAGVAAVPDANGGGKVGTHYEIRSKQGEPELVLMRVTKERKAEIMKAKAEAAQRLATAGESAGKTELRQLGASTITGDRAGASWQDR